MFFVVRGTIANEARAVVASIEVEARLVGPLNIQLDPS